MLHHPLEHGAEQPDEKPSVTLSAAPRNLPSLFIDVTPIFLYLAGALLGAFFPLFREQPRQLGPACPGPPPSPACAAGPLSATSAVLREGLRARGSRRRSRPRRTGIPAPGRTPCRRRAGRGGHARGLPRARAPKATMEIKLWAEKRAQLENVRSMPTNTRTGKPRCSNPLHITINAIESGQQSGNERRALLPLLSFTPHYICGYFQRASGVNDAVGLTWRHTAAFPLITPAYIERARFFTPH